MSVLRVVLAIACLVFPCARAAQAQTLAAGAEHTVVVTPDGHVWAWGGNTSGQLGDGTTTRIARLPRC